MYSLKTNDNKRVKSLRKSSEKVRKISVEINMCYI